MRDINIFLIIHSAKNQVKYVVFEEDLLYLFACPSCHLSTPTITKHECGTFIRVKQTCEHCEAVNIWDSQPFINSQNKPSISFTTLAVHQSLQECFTNINESISFLLSSEHGASNKKDSSQYC